MENHIFGIDPRGQGAVDLNAANFQLAQGQGLRGQHIAHLAGANAKGDRPKGPMGRGMAVSAGNGHTRLSQPLFRGNHMDDALVAGANVVKANVVGLAVRSRACIISSARCRQRAGPGFRWAQCDLPWPPCALETSP
jgi:hypothetical protein